MRRQRRRHREIPFSFDSFLDVVANIVGIIIRLILVVWVGARSYPSLQRYIAQHTAPASKVVPAERDPDDPLKWELEQHRRQLAEAQARLLQQLRQWQQAKDTHSQIEGELVALSARRQGVDQERASLDRTAADGAGVSRTAAFSLAELQQRQKRLLNEIHALEKLPPIQQVLRYQTPVSSPVQADEFMFECRGGRVTFIDIPALTAEICHDLEEKAQLLQTRWQVSDVSPTIGAFRLRYTVERQRKLEDGLLAGTAPSSSAVFRYGLSGWEVEPVTLVRGETGSAALARGSEFRRLVDSLDPRQAVVTFWVYPDSFALYRQLRDYLYERNLVVAGRPLPAGVPIGCSRNGSVSRGQ
jgi:hypothetical protein